MTDEPKPKEAVCALGWVVFEADAPKPLNADSAGFCWAGVLLNMEEPRPAFWGLGDSEAEGGVGLKADGDDAAGVDVVGVNLNGEAGAPVAAVSGCEEAALFS